MVNFKSISFSSIIIHIMPRYDGWFKWFSFQAKKKAQSSSKKSSLNVQKKQNDNSSDFLMNEYTSMNNYDDYGDFDDFM